MRILILDDDTELRSMLSARIEEALRQAGMRRVELIESDFASLANLLAESPPAVSFLGPGCYRNLEEDLSRYRVVYPRVPVGVVLGNEVYAAEAVELRRTLRVRIMPVADVGQIAQFILDSDVSGSGTSSQAAVNGGIITVAQLKGGVGCSTMAGALAACWARHGLSVALVDLDDVNPQITDWGRVGASQKRLISESVKAGVVENFRLRELLTIVEDYDERLAIFGQPEYYGEGFHFKADVLEAAPSIVGYINSLFVALQEQFDVVVVDSGRSWGLSTFTALTLSQHVLLVVDDDTLSLHRTLENMSRIYKESDDPKEFDLAKWSFLLNAHTGRILEAEQMRGEIEAIDIFPNQIHIDTLPYSDAGREWGITSLSFFDNAEEEIQNLICEIAYRFVPFQFEASSTPLYAKIRRGLKRIVS